MFTSGVFFEVLIGEEKVDTPRMPYHISTDGLTAQFYLLLRY